MRDYVELVAELRLAAERKTIAEKTRDACRTAADAIEELLAAVNLPEHGDLIDRDALFKQMGVTDMDCYKCEFGNHGFCGRGEFSAACEAIEDAPVIVPSNKEESE